MTTEEVFKPQHNRFKDAPWYPSAELRPVSVIIGGAGGIGSWTAFLLARAGFTPFVYDFDTLEQDNLGGQLYPKRMVGNLKVEALQQIIKDFSDEEIEVSDNKVDEDSVAHSYMISAFDNMTARKIMYNLWLASYGHDPNALYIDGRLDAERLQIFCIKGGADNVENQHKYLTEYLFDDSEVEDAPCTMKQTSHAAAMIGSYITSFFTNHYTNVKEGEQLRTINFKWEYFIPMDLLEVTN